MEPQNALENATHAMALADEWLGVPPVGTIKYLYIFVLAGGKQLPKIIVI